MINGEMTIMAEGMTVETEEVMGVGMGVGMDAETEGIIKNQ
jgi:hypothetical protein